MGNVSKVGVFASSLLVAASAVYIYSPVIGSHADSSATVRTRVNVEPIASITVSTDNLNIDVSPSESGTFSSEPIVATVNTNSPGGYELYFSSEDNNTDMTNIDSEIADVIASDFSSTVTSTTMAANKWGYSLDDTDFSKIPTLAEQAKIRDLDHRPSAEEKLNTVYIGTKINSTLAAGTYQKNVKFSVVAHAVPEPPTLADISTMQEMTPGIVNNTEAGVSKALTDTRDGNIYTVKKLADGNIWMTENLRIADKTITPADSNVTSDFTIPASSSTTRADDLDANVVYIDDTYGGYYTFYTATAGTGDSSLAVGEEAPSSICPKGWRLPTSGKSGGEFQALYEHYNSDTLMQGEPGFIFSGEMQFGYSLSRAGALGRFWSSTTHTEYSSAVYVLDMSSGYVSSHNAIAKNYTGASIHCIAI